MNLKDGINRKFKEFLDDAVHAQDVEEIITYARNAKAKDFVTKLEQPFLKENSGNSKKKSPGFPVGSRKVPETTLTDASVTYKQSVSHERTNEDLKTSDFKDWLTKTYVNQRTVADML